MSRLSDIRFRDSIHTHSLKLSCDIAFLLELVDRLKAEIITLKDELDG